MGGIRRRKTETNIAETVGSASASKTNVSGHAISPETTPAQPDDENEQTMQHIILRHPLLWALLLIGIPYALYIGRIFLLLQHPEWLPFLKTRPAVSMEDPRQLLVVGAIASGTTQVSHELSVALDIEVGYEDSNSLWGFVRDGTVSWLHGIRFLDPAKKFLVVPRICQISQAVSPYSLFYLSNNYGFGQTVFGSPVYKKSFLHPKFGEEWLSECNRLAGREYGCAVDRTCHTPYARTLLQLRHPKRIAVSLTNKYCRDSAGNALPAPKALLQLLYMLLFPVQPEQALNVFIKTPQAPEHCTWQVAHYVLWWYRDVLLPAVSRRLIDNQYQIESSGVCSVASLAGLDAVSTTVYAPNHESFQYYCTHNKTNSQRLFGRTQNVKQHELQELELPGQSHQEIMKLETELEELAVQMGYTGSK